jgi:hypothetical protein
MSSNTRSFLAYGAASLYPTNWGWAAYDLATHPVAAFRFFLPGPGGVTAWRELFKKTEVFLLVPGVSSLLGVPSSPPFPLLELVARAYRMEPFPALWAVEGLGHDYGDSVWNQGEVPHDLLTGPRAAALPPKSLLMLHAGIGLSIAQRLLGTLGLETAEAELARTLGQIVALIRENSRPGYVGAALESIGLVTRTFHPGRVQAAGRLLAELDPEVADFFWHGAGRALYFLLVNLLPCGNSTWRGFEMAMGEAPDARARANASAGMAWAFVLVNQQQPEVVADFLRTHRSFVTDNEGFVNGLASTIVMRADTTPGAPFVESFCAYQPADADLAQLWDEVVRTPCRTALTEIYPALRAADRLGQLFRFHPLPELLPPDRGWQRVRRPLGARRRA